MSDPRKLKMKAFTELGKLLTPETVERLQNAISIPARISQDTGTNPTFFLNSLKNWNDFNPQTFDLALQAHGDQTILSIARQLEWLSTPHSKPMPPSEEAKPATARSLVELLTSEMSRENWVALTSSNAEVSVKGDEGSMEMLQVCIESSIITRDMDDLCSSLEIIERNDLAIKVRKFETTFLNIPSDVFREQIHQELEPNESVVSVECVSRLRKFLKTQNKDVSVVFDEASVPIESVYTPLTVIKVKPAMERMKEESGINEIQFLRDIHQQVEHHSVEVVDFESIVTSSDSSESGVWCLIGNPGSGKSFLCKHFAFMYGINQLTNFRYTISIPCRSQEWHELEQTRHEAKKSVDEEFILSWLSLSMSTGTKWSKSLSQHLLRSDGEGLLILMDGADEFATAVPFESTLLCKILLRRFLTLSTILITSRPSAWTELLLAHGSEFKIDANFQVLGFSPENRDLYFEKRIETIEKLNAVHELFHLHDEIKQLALVPVNASLFSALFNQSDSILSNTLSHLYTQLVVYIIRRQLARMGLKEQSKVLAISDFLPAIKESIDAIGTEANQGIFERELTSDKHIPLKIGGKTYESERLGLMQAHMKVVSFGRRVKVWTFQHLTIQEFMAALSICDNSWPNQCYIIRYLTSSTQYLAMYKMVVRFMYGILRQDAGCITPILCRHALPLPMPLHDAPMYHQLYYSIELVGISDWREFTELFLFLCTVIMESNSDTIPEHFSYFKREFPFPLFLYFQSTISPNEWHCFLKSLKYVSEYQIIQFQSDYVTAPQFQSFLTQLSTCDIHYLALSFVEKDYDTIHPYTSSLNSVSLPPNTRVSIELNSCDLSACDTSQRLFSSANQFTGSLSLYEPQMNQQMLEELTNQFSSLQCLYYSPKSDESDWSILHQSITNNPINGLYIYDINAYLPVTPAILSGLSSLTELYWWTREDCYRVLPYLPRNNSLTQLNLFSMNDPSPDESPLHSLTELIASNSNSLRDIHLP